MHISDLNGSYYEMGVEQGRLLKSVGFAPPPASAAKQQLARACEAAAREHVPELQDELRGIADGGGFDSDLLNALALTLDAQPACSVFAVSGEHTADGKTLFGRNYDFYSSFRDFAVLYRTRADGALANLGCSDIFVGREDGINEAGLAIAMTFVSYERDQPGIMFHLAVRAVLERCHNVREAAALLESIPHMRNNNYLVADASGQIAIVEAGPRNVSLIDAAGGFAAITNHFQFGPYEHLAGRPTNSESRLSNLQEWFTRRDGYASSDSVKAVLSDPERGVFCSHYQDQQDVEPIVTLWSWEAALGEHELHLSDGMPDQNSYKAYQL